MVPGSGCPSPTAGSTAPRMLSLGFTRVLVSFAPAEVWSQRAKGQAVQTSPQGALLIPAKRSPPAAALHRSFFGSGCRERDGHGCVLLLSQCALRVASAFPPPLKTMSGPMGCLSVGVGRECPGKPPTALGEGAAAPRCHTSTHSCAHLRLFWHLWLRYHPLKALHQPAQHARSCPAGRAGVVRAHPASCIPCPAPLHPTSHISHPASLHPSPISHPASLYPTSRNPPSHIPCPSILHPSNPTSVHPTSFQTVPNPASNIPCLPQILCPRTCIPQPTIPHCKFLILQSFIPHILHPPSHTPPS